MYTSLAHVSKVIFSETFLPDRHSVFATLNHYVIQVNLNLYTTPLKLYLMSLR